MNRRVIALDNRGHGESTKLYDPSDYHTSKMADDVRALLDHLGIGKVHLLGHSMGGRTVTRFAGLFPERALTLTIEDMHLIATLCAFVEYAEPA